MSHQIAYEHTKREFKLMLDSRKHEAQKRAERARALPLVNIYKRTHTYTFTHTHNHTHRGFYA